MGPSSSRPVGHHPRGGGGHLTWAESTIAELKDWERNGAVWRPVEIRGGRAVVDMCSCTGELMERVESADPGFVDFVRAHRDE